MSFNTVLVTSRSPATLIFGAQGGNAGPIQVINFDPNNTITFANASNVQAGQLGGAIALGPFASMAFDGTVALYGITPAGQTAEVAIVPGGGNYSPGSLTISGPVTASISGPVTVSSITTPVDIGTVSGSIDIAAVAGSVNVNGAVNATGVGGFINPGQIGNLFNSPVEAIAAGTTVNISSSINVANYTSIVLATLNLTNSSVAAGAAVCAIFHITWFDSIGDETCVDTVSTLLGANVSPTWEIPVRGSTCTVSVQNVGTVGTISISAGNVIVDGSYRAIPNVRVTQGFIGAPLPTLTGCTTLLQANPVFQVATWIAAIQESWAAAVANMVFPLPQWAGEVTGFYQIITTALAKNATIVDLTYALQGQVLSGGNYAFGVIQNIPGSIDANPVPITFNLPPTQCAVIIDTPAAAGEFFLSLIGVGN
jgi:hypothetical protein